MSADWCWLTSEVDAGLAVVRFLADFTGPDRAEAVHLVLKQLRQRTEPDRVLACELAWEAHTGGDWGQQRDDDPQPPEGGGAEFRGGPGVASWRRRGKRLAVCRRRTAAA